MEAESLDGPCENADPGAVGFVVVQHGTRRGCLVVQRRSECEEATDNHEVFRHACYPFYLFTANGRILRRIAEDGTNLGELASRYH